MAETNQRKGRCGVCGEELFVRYIDLYIVGSEGLHSCHGCELLIVDEIQRMKRMMNMGFQRGYKLRTQ